jgi:iron complex transport system substrate-binding protein
LRAFAWLLGLSLLGSATASTAAPRRAVSLNLCTDEMLLLLAFPSQIASVTHLAHRPEETRLAPLARRYRRNDGSLLSVFALKPDLVLTMGGGVRDRQAIAQRLGIAVLDLPYPQQLADVQRNLVLVAHALGRTAAARALNARIDALKRTSPHAAADTLWIGGGGRTVAADGLAAEWMRLAGLRQRQVRGDRVELEQLLTRPPQVLLRSDYRRGQYSSEQRWLSHPLARRVRAEQSLATDGRAWTCMGPTVLPEIERLRRELAK